MRAEPPRIQKPIRRHYPEDFLDAVVAAVEADTSGLWQTARAPGLRAVLAAGTWGLSQRALSDALPYLAEEGRIDYYIKGRYGPAGTRRQFLDDLHAERADGTAPNVRYF